MQRVVNMRPVPRVECTRNGQRDVLVRDRVRHDDDVVDHSRQVVGDEILDAAHEFFLLDVLVQVGEALDDFGDEGETALDGRGGKTWIVWSSR